MVLGDIGSLNNVLAMVPVVVYAVFFGFAFPLVGRYWTKEKIEAERPAEEETRRAA